MNVVNKMRRGLYFLIQVMTLLALVGFSDLKANEGIEASVMTEDWAVETAIRENPNLAQIKARFQALSQIPSQVGTLPDPTLKLNAMNLPVDTFDLAQEPMTQLQFGFSQTFPFPGKLGLKKQAAEFDANAMQHSVNEMRLQIIKKVKIKWWQIAYLDRALEIVDRNKSVLQQFIKVASTKYETGEGLQQDVLLAQLELSKLLGHQIQLNALHGNLRIGLNILMDRYPNEEIKLPKIISKLLPNLIKEDALYQKAELVRPKLHEMLVKVDAAESRLKLAKRGYYPDFTIGMVYGDRSGMNPLPRGGDRTDFVSLMVGIKLPLYAGRKQAKLVSQKNSELDISRNTNRLQKGLVMAEISTAINDYHQSRQQFILFESGIVPQAQQTVASMLAAYQVSEVDFLNLMRAQITLFNYELQYWKALSDANQALAMLEAAAGEVSVYE